MTDKVSHLSNLKQDTENARAHNPRNIGMITTALHTVGAARSIVIDEDDIILAGNGVYEAAVNAGIENVKVVEADGETIIAVRRSNLTSEQKKKLSYFDNRTGELADWNVEQMVADLESGLDLSAMFREDELEAMVVDFTVPDPEPQQEPTLPSDHFIEIYCNWDDLEAFRPTLTEWSGRDGVTVNIS